MNRSINISTAGSRKEKFWKSERLLWSEFIDRLKNPSRSPETLENYLKLPKASQDDLKDVGGFVAGKLKDGLRRNANLLTRDLITLDLDNIEPGKSKDVLNKLSSLKVSYAVYSTRKHAEYRPRLRVVFLADREMAVDEYEPVARKIGELIGIEMCDPTTFEPARLMYWPSCSSDSEYVYNYDKESPALSVDGILGKYKDWKNIDEWPKVPGSENIVNRLIKKQGDPLEKTGVVGAFCKNYSIVEAVSKFIPEVYSISDDGSRLTYLEGSTANGVVVYDNKFAYSHHATDPAGGKLCNAFDLIRIHKFENLDEQAKAGTPANRLPSFIEMANFSRSIPEISKQLNAEIFQASDDFEKIDGLDLEWMNNLKRNENGKCLKTIENCLLVLENDPRIKGKFAIDEFNNRAIVTGNVPWDKSEDPRIYRDVDDSGVRNYLESVYGLSGENKIYDALTLVSYKLKFNSVRKYLEGLKWDGVKRIETLLHDYLGAEKGVYTAEVMRASLTAAVARAIDGGVKYDCMPIFTGPQGLGKSTFLAKLGKEWYSDSLESFEGKEASELIQGTWINELGELTSFSKSETNMIKRFLSKTDDIYRKAYGRNTEKYPRRCVFFGTSNDTEFLRDKTGNRRFWPVAVGVKKSTKSIWVDLDKEVDQIWAEAYLNYIMGEELDLNKEAQKVAKEMQDEYSVKDVREGEIVEFLNKKVSPNWHSKTHEERRDFYTFVKSKSYKGELVERDRVCALEILVECFKMRREYIKYNDSMSINVILDHLKGWEKIKFPLRFGEFGMQRGYKRVTTSTDYKVAK